MEVFRALGLDENTALICDEAKECKVIGEAGVWFVDLSSAQVCERRIFPFFTIKLRLHSLNSLALKPFALD